MPTKSEVIEDVEKSIIKHYTKEMVLFKLKSVRAPKPSPPSRLKKGDVFTTNEGGASKCRPYVVVSVGDRCSLCIPLSTTKDCMNLSESSSRFFGDGYFSKSFVSFHNSFIMNNFVGVYDNQKKLELAQKKMREFIKNQ